VTFTSSSSATHLAEAARRLGLRGRLLGFRRFRLGRLPAKRCANLGWTPAAEANLGMVWLLLVPLFNLVWNFFVVMSIAKSVSNEYARRGQPSPEPAPGQPLGLAMSICACCCIIPFLSIFAGLANLVLWIVYWVKIAEYSRNLDLPQIAVPVPPSI
jgi:hypothetical protein